MAVAEVAALSHALGPSPPAIAAASDLFWGGFWSRRGQAVFWADPFFARLTLIKRRMSTAFHLQTNGQTEILNRILENYLQAYTSLEQMN